MLFCDEPTGELDSTAATEVMDFICDLNAEGTTVMLVTHDAKVAARTERLLYMIDGRIVGDRDQGLYAGADLEQRRAAVMEWVIEQDQGVGRRGALG